MIHYNKQDIEYLLQGAAFLGAGGGGALDGSQNAQAGRRRWL